MSNGYPVLRQLSKIELIDIHVLVMATRPALRLPKKEKNETRKP